MSTVSNPTNLCFPRFHLAEPNPNKHRDSLCLTHTHTQALHPECQRCAPGRTSLQTLTHKTAAASQGGGGPEKSLRAPSTVWTPLRSTSTGPVLSHSLTLLCMTTTLWLSALSQVSMALQMLQILSRAGAWWSGQPKSNTYRGRGED